MGRVKVIHPTDKFVTPKLAGHLAKMRGLMWKAPHEANKHRFRELKGSVNSRTISDFAVGATGMRILKDWKGVEIKFGGKKIRIGRDATRGATKGIGHAFAAELQRFPEFKRQVESTGKKFVYVNAKGELILTNRKQVLGFGRHRMKISDLLATAGPEYIEGEMAGHSVSFVRYGAEFKIYNQATGAEQKIEFEQVLKKELIDAAGGKKIRLVMKDGSIIEIMVPHLANPEDNAKMIKQIQYWLELKKR
ncbi:Uncharacterised protein [uncultured archaeon]|nr:Uncharacterised protein [uncultured archaeon]